MNTRIHYFYIHATRVHPPQKYGRHYLYRASCFCGFSVEAFGRILTENQLEGHFKTMEWLKEQGKEK